MLLTIKIFQWNINIITGTIFSKYNRENKSQNFVARQDRTARPGLYVIPVLENVCPTNRLLVIVCSINTKSLFPYILLFITLLMVFLEATWRFSDLDKLVSVLDFVIDGLEESIRDVIEFLVDEDGGSRMDLTGM